MFFGVIVVFYFDFKLFFKNFGFFIDKYKENIIKKFDNF